MFKLLTLRQRLYKLNKSYTKHITIRDTLNIYAYTDHNYDILEDIFTNAINNILPATIRTSNI